MKKKTIVDTISFIFAAVIITAALIYSNFSITMITFSATIGIFVVFIVIRERRQRKLKLVVQDELTEKIALKSIRISWIAALMMISVISLLNFFNIKTLSVNEMVTVLYLGMIFSLHISRIIYEKKLEAE